MTAGTAPRDGGAGDPRANGAAPGTPPGFSEDLPSFDVCGPLPDPGVTLLEASAGTGKTYTIASLAARYLAGGLPVEELLVVTFTRAATGELRDRVRRRLVEAGEGLARARRGLPAGGDSVVALLATGSRAELEARGAAIEQALRRFDGATIATTHGFCEQMLAGLGVAGEPLYDVSFLEDLRDLADEVADDLFVRRVARGLEMPVALGESRAIAEQAVANPDVSIEPSGDLPPGDQDAVRRALALRAREVYEQRKLSRSLIGYDDLQLKLRDALVHGRGGVSARRRLAGRYRVVLVDEFQDTDPVQWQVLEEAFVAAGVTLVLIGDPKQAIYSFRGADVFTYLEAAGRADHRAGLSVNWRSDGGLLAGFDALFAGAQLGHAGITYRPVRAAPAHEAQRLVGAPVAAPLRLRVLPRAGRRLNSGDSSIKAEDLRPAIVADLVADLVGLLASGAQLPEDGGAGLRPIHPGDVAVLVHRNRDARSIRDALAEAGTPAVMLGTDSVYQSPAAGTWLHLLEALEQPGDRARVARVALGDFVGWDAEKLALAAEDDWAQLSALLHRYDAALRDGGVAALYSALLRIGDVPARLLAQADGERAMTDLAHVAQLLHAAAIEDQLGERALAGWLRRRIETVADEGNAEGLSRRLERDEDAVQVVTVHRSKGLEFSIVYAPYLFVPPYVPTDGPFVFHEAAEAGLADRRVLEVGRVSRESEAHRRAYAGEQRNESLRLAYVALTRARHQAVVWWAPMRQGGQSPLARLLFTRGEGGELAETARIPSDEGTFEALEALAGRAPAGTVTVERVGSSRRREALHSRRGEGAPPDPDGLEAAVFGRLIDTSWRRTSYSGLVAASHADPGGADPAARDALDDEPAAPPPPLPPQDAPAGRPVPLGALPGGVDVGTFVHHVLEELDFAATDLAGEVRRRVESAPGRDRLSPAERGILVGGLCAAIATPLGPLFGEMALRQVERADRLDELEFELPLAGGEQPSGELRLADLADVLEAHLAPGEALAAYPARLRDPLLEGPFRGYLTGSIDLVVRAAGGYLVVDYKTNRFAAEGSELAAWHYRPAALAEEMMAAHYPLQALLYAVALHRYLRWRVRGYDPGEHLRGIAYLFLRGMVGEDTPRVDGQPCGVFAWSLPEGLVEALSALLDAGGQAGPGRSRGRG